MYGSVPRGIVESPFTWIYYGEEIPMHLISGFLGLEQTDDGFLKCQIGWAIG